MTLSGRNTTRIFTVNAGITLELDNITLSDGDADGSGGAILNNDGIVTITNTAPVVSTPTVTPSNTSQTGRTTLGAPAEEFSSSDEGASVVASATFYDPGIPDYHTRTVDYGDGSGPQTGIVESMAAAWSHSAPASPWS